MWLLYQEVQSQESRGDGHREWGREDRSSKIRCTLVLATSKYNWLLHLKGPPSRRPNRQRLRTLLQEMEGRIYLPALFSPWSEVPLTGTPAHLWCTGGHWENPTVSNTSAGMGEPGQLGRDVSDGRRGAVYGCMRSVWISSVSKSGTKVSGDQWGQEEPKKKPHLLNVLDSPAESRDGWFHPHMYPHSMPRKLPCNSMKPPIVAHKLKSNFYCENQLSI